jgi:predicted ribonuclease toxin of YeeF-YezG toxin-antitoxin module
MLTPEQAKSVNSADAEIQDIVQIDDVEAEWAVLAL